MADSDFNLLEWYAAHRGEVELLRDPAALFALGLLDHVGETSRGEFQQDLGVDAAQLDRTIDLLYKAGFVNTQGTTLAITAQGKQFLTEIGLRGPLPPPPTGEGTTEPPTPSRPLVERPTVKPPPPASRTPFWLWGLIGLLVVGILVVFWLWNANPAPTPATRVAEEMTVRATRGREIPTEITRPPERVTRIVQRPTPTAFDVPGTIIVLEASPTTVSPNGCTLLTWQVENALEVLFGDEQVGKQGSQRECLDETTDYTLTVITLGGEKLTKTVQVVVTEPETNYVWTIVGKDAPFDNLRLQNALALAVDEPAIAKAVLQGTGNLRNSDPKLDELQFDLARAQELSKQAEYQGQPVFIVPNADRTSSRLASAIANALEAAGFQVRLVNVESRATILVGPDK